MEMAQGKKETGAGATGPLTQDPTAPPQALVRLSPWGPALLSLPLSVECVTPPEQPHQAPPPGQRTSP